MTFSGLFWTKKASLGSLRDYHTYLCQILLTEFSSLSLVLYKEFNVCTNIFISKPMYPYVTINCRFALCRIQTSIHTQGRRTKFGHGGKNYLTFRARGASENFSTPSALPPPLEAPLGELLPSLPVLRLCTHTH